MKDNSNSTLLVNFFAGPGARKSTMAASVFSKLKWLNYNCELVAEFAKDKVWEDSLSVLDNQIYVFAKQHHRIWRLLGKVDIIITDSPFVSSCVYDKENRATLAELARHEHNKLNTLNFFINRNCIFNPKGRIQNEEQSKKLDSDIRNFLDALGVKYSLVDGEERKVMKIVKTIINTTKTTKGKEKHG